MHERRSGLPDSTLPTWLMRRQPARCQNLGFDTETTF